MKKIILIALVVLLLGAALYYFMYGRETFKASFSWQYRREHQDKVTYEIPEVFELTNIAIAISDNGLKDPFRVNKNTTYYQKVLDHFLQYRNHPLIKEIEQTWNNDYYVFLNGALCYSFNGDNQLVRETVYKNVYKMEVFNNRKELLEDFARVSGFREFYRDHSEYYQQEIVSAALNLPVKRAWSWLESQFPLNIDSYKVVFSPLLGSTHNTFSFRNPGFTESVMIVSNPNKVYHHNQTISEAVNTRIIFTELDHNYVNRVTDKYKKEITETLEDIENWKRNNTGYAQPYLTFNEYLTWAVFNLYAHDLYEQNDYSIIEREVNRIMVKERGFYRFEEFNTFLLNLYLEQKEEQIISQLYPLIIEWFRSN